MFCLNPKRPLKGIVASSIVIGLRSDSNRHRKVRKLPHLKGIMASSIVIGLRSDSNRHRKVRKLPHLKGIMASSIVIGLRSDSNRHRKVRKLPHLKMLSCPGWPKGISKLLSLRWYICSSFTRGTTEAKPFGKEFMLSMEHFINPMVTSCYQNMFI